MKLFYKVKQKLLSYFKKTVEPPSYDVKRATLKGYQEKYGLGILVETGTFLGDTVEFFKNSFSTVYSIELAEELAAKAQKRFANDANVRIIQGDSGVVLKDIVKINKEPILFWLDGHYSSEFFLGDEYIKTAKGDLDTPVEEELKTILATGVQHVVLIDDARLFTGVGDYPSIGKVKSLVKKLNNNYTVFVENDMIHVLPK